MSDVDHWPRRTVVPVMHYERLRRENLPIMLASGTSMLGSEVLLFGYNKAKDEDFIKRLLDGIIVDQPRKYGSIAVFDSTLTETSGLALMIGFSGVIEGHRAPQVITEKASMVMAEANEVLAAESKGGLRIPEVAGDSMLLP